MDRTIKLLAASSVVMLTMTACAPGYSPYGPSGTGSTSTYEGGSSYSGDGATKAAVTHSHGGKVHSHALPGTGLRHTHATGSGYGGGYTGGGGSTYVPPVPPRNPNPYPQQQYNPGNNNGGVPHSHCGRVHSHPLPGQGLAHTHGNPACPAGQASGQQGAGQYGGQQQGGSNQQQANNNGYDYAYGGNTNKGSGNNTYDYSGQAGNGQAGNGANNNSYYSYGDSGTSSNNNNATYYDSTQPKAPATYYDNNTNANTNYDYSSPNASGSGSTDSYASGSGSSGGSFTPNNYSGGNSYTVKRGDTVFQVMRNTGVYWKDIIRLNNLQAPNYQINPGQSLRLK